MISDRNDIHVSTEINSVRLSSSNKDNMYTGIMICFAHISWLSVVWPVGLSREVDWYTFTCNDRL